MGNAKPFDRTTLEEAFERLGYLVRQRSRLRNEPSDDNS